MNNEVKNVIITCPHCGQQYILDEVFYRDDFSGRPTTIIKDAIGKILYVEYKEGYNPAYSQRFTCDGCNRPFIAEATVSVKTSAEVAEKDFTAPVSLW